MAVSVSPRGSVVTAQQVLGNQASNATGLANSNELVVRLDSNRRYTVTSFIMFQLNGATSGFKFKLVVPASATASQILYEVIDCQSATPVFLGTNLNGTEAVTATVVGNHLLRITGHIEMGPPDGGSQDLQFQFAQNVLDAVNAISVRKNSYLQVQGF